MATTNTGCVFGSNCVRPEGRSIWGARICGYCKNKSFEYLKASARNDIFATGLVYGYREELRIQSDKTTQQNGLHLCAMRHPKYRKATWRLNFHRDSDEPCNDPVKMLGEICQRCQSYIADQLMKDPNALPEIRDELQEGKYFGFYCAFMDPIFNNDIKHTKWRFRYIPNTPNHLPDWFPPQKTCENVEDKPFHDQYCTELAQQQGSVCSTCFKRIKNVEGWNRFFDSRGALDSSIWKTERESLNSSSPFPSQSHYKKLP